MSLVPLQKVGGGGGQKHISAPNHTVGIRTIFQNDFKLCWYPVLLTILMITGILIYQFFTADKVNILYVRIQNVELQMQMDIHLSLILIF